MAESIIRAHFENSGAFLKQVAPGSQRSVRLWLAEPRSAWACARTKFDQVVEAGLRLCSSRPRKTKEEREKNSEEAQRASRNRPKRKRRERNRQRALTAHAACGHGRRRHKKHGRRKNEATISQGGQGKPSPPKPHAKARGTGVSRQDCRLRQERVTRASNGVGS